MKVGDDGFLAGARSAEGGAPGEGAEAFEGGAAVFEEIGDEIEVGFGGGLVGVGEGDDLLEPGAGFDEDEFAGGAWGGGRARAKGLQVEKCNLLGYTDRMMCWGGVGCGIRRQVCNPIGYTDRGG